MERSLIVLKVVSFIYMLVLLPSYIYYDNKPERPNSMRLKMTLSAMFCIVGLIGATLNDFSIYSIFVLFGLFFALIGDYYLIFIKLDASKFIKGVLFFCITQIFYITSMHSVAALSFWNISFAAVIYAIIIYFIIKNKVDLESAKYPLYVYSLLVVLMAVKAVSMTYTSTHSLQSSIMFAAGALLFLVSDLFLGSYVYVDNKNMFKVFNSITYFSGQLLIASSLFYI